ncbi:hypothetical protein [Erythrobacter sp. HKB08]|uniref:hypothetical protein n=1 Tax=Erythrobacter sp. HKB08 TaxID=2502843 RepID=UPI0010089F8A|nr:hypothetical protein [Erythrobacter sp. HKB08]
MLRRISLLALPLLAACSTVTPPPSPGTTPDAPVTRSQPYVPPPQTQRPVQPSTPGGFRAPRVMNLPGVEGLIGANAGQITRQFGEPRLDVVEGDARKLQFSGEACVLDIYLYPLSPGAEPTATYVDARRASDGLDVDRVSCVRALLRR